MTRWGLIASALLGGAVMVSDLIAGNVGSAVAVGLAAFCLGATLVFFYQALVVLTGGSALPLAERAGVAAMLRAERDLTRRQRDGLRLDVGLGRLAEQDAEEMLAPLDQRLETLETELAQLDAGELDALDLAMRTEVRRRLEEEASS
jgi:hypothetical protein